MPVCTCAYKGEGASTQDRKGYSTKIGRKVTHEQTPECNEGMRKLTTWGKAFQAKAMAGRKALKGPEYVLSLHEQ